MATEVCALIPGKVVELLVAVGDEVEQDEPIVLLEALKMKTPVVAPVRGTVKELRVKAGQDVDSDTVLAIIDD